jgi:hypothetical protein
MWEAIFFQKEHLTNCISELCEMNLIYRCLEKIRNVDAVQLGFKMPDEEPQPDKSEHHKEEKAGKKMEGRIKRKLWHSSATPSLDQSLTCKLYCKRWISHIIKCSICETDAVASSWKVRFLVKAREVLRQHGRQNVKPPTDNRKLSISGLDFHGGLDIAGIHSDLIECDIQHILLFVTIFLRSSNQFAFSIQQGDFRSPYYIIITI